MRGSLTLFLPWIISWVLPSLQNQQGVVQARRTALLAAFAPNLTWKRKVKMGAGASIPASEEDALAAGFTPVQIQEYVARGMEVVIPETKAETTAAVKLDGTALAAASLANTREAVDVLVAAGHEPPALLVIVVGHDPASAAYIKRKVQSAAACGVEVAVTQLEEADTTESGLLDLVRNANANPAVHGIIVQLPLPGHVDAARVTQAVAHAKDVDGFTHQSLGSVVPVTVPRGGGGNSGGRNAPPYFCPCTPLGCLEILRSVPALTLRGKEAVVIGASQVVGTPMALLLLGEGCTVTICHADTADTAAHARRADILVSAAGVAGLVQTGWVKPGAVVLDVGINFIPDSSKKSGSRMVGDVDPGVASTAGFLTPVPGGVGPMTVRPSSPENRGSPGAHLFLLPSPFLDRWPCL